MDETSILVTRVTRGDVSALERLVPLVYEQLRRIALRQLTFERSGHTLQPTALVHEAYLRLVDRTRVDWKGRTHLVAVAAREMRRVLVDHARARNAVKRGGERERILVDVESALAWSNDIDVLELEDTLERFAELDPRAASAVVLKFFGGLTHEEVAEALGIAPRTARDDWKTARAWLRRDLRGDDEG